jgi:hypothetical protein
MLFCQVAQTKSLQEISEGLACCPWVNHHNESGILELQALVLLGSTDCHAADNMSPAQIEIWLVIVKPGGPLKMEIERTCTMENTPATGSEQTIFSKGIVIAYVILFFVFWGI